LRSEMAVLEEQIEVLQRQLVIQEVDLRLPRARIMRGLDRLGTRAACRVKCWLSGV